MNRWVWISASILLVTFAQLTLKVGMLKVPTDTSLANMLNFATGAEGLPFIVPIALGLLAYCLSVVCWISALTRFPLNLAYPLLSVSYLLVYVAAMFVPTIQETSNPLRLLGIALVVIGIGFVAWPSKIETHTDY